ncbi:MAG: type II secretion system protein, partial [Candidatus Omnitrophica bacterium]|nr:type II secretion system protein [Candidatus Omnitrophota bacterium]
MDRKAFSLLEMIVVVMIIAILSAVGVFVWDEVISNTKTQICEQNQMIIKDALKYYIADNEAVPLSLSQITPEYTDLALARLNEKSPGSMSMRKFYIALLKIDGTSTACAGEFVDYVGGNADYLECPMNEGGGISYGYNIELRTGIQNASVDGVQLFKELEADNIPIICDSDNDTFTAGDNGNITGAALRHGRRIIAAQRLAVAVGGEDTICVISTGNNWSSPKKERQARRRKKARNPKNKDRRDWDNTDSVYDVDPSISATP